jgi:hypothetical protein
MSNFLYFIYWVHYKQVTYAKTSWTKCKKKFLDVSSVLGLLHCVVVGDATTFQRSMLPPPSGWHMDPEDGDSMHLQNTANITHIHTVQQPKNRININNKLPWEPKISKVKFLLAFTNSCRYFLFCNPGKPLYYHNYFTSYGVKIIPFSFLFGDDHSTLIINQFKVLTPKLIHKTIIHMLLI